MQMYCAERLQMLREKVEIVFYSLYFHPILSLSPLYATVTKRDSQLLIQANSSLSTPLLPSLQDLICGKKETFFSPHTCLPPFTATLRVYIPFIP